MAKVVIQIYHGCGLDVKGFVKMDPGL